MRNVKSINEVFYNMRCLVMFITAVCLLFLLKLKWPKNKSVYDLLEVRCEVKPQKITGKPQHGFSYNLTRNNMLDFPSMS